ncbi:hypothetical protein Tco_1405076 [Tanacetum coccineum]
MDTTRAQQKALDDDLVAPVNRLKIGKCNLRLSSNLNSKEPTLQVVLDALKLTSFYKAFQINADICPKLPRQKFEDPPFEEENLSFIRDLGHTGEIKCLSGKTTALESLRLSRAQNKNVDYVYLLWVDLVFPVENKNSKKNNDMYYPRFTKVIVDYFMVKDQAIPRRNKMFWHFARDDSMFITIRVIFKHQDTHVYGVILPQHLTNQVMLESDAYKTYHAYATGEKIPKPKYVKNKADPESSPKKKSAQASKGKRIKSSPKVAKPVKKKQLATTSNEKGLNVLSEVALSEAEHIKLATKRSLIQTHSSHTSSSGADEGTGKSSDEDDDDEVNVSKDDDNQNDDDADNEDDDEVIVSEDDDDLNDDNADNEGDDDQDDDNEYNKSNNNDGDLVNPKLSTFYEKEGQDEEDKEEEWSDDEAYDDETQGVNVEGEELDEEETKKEDKVNELYKDVNVNLEGKDTEITDAPQTNIQEILSRLKDNEMMRMKTKNPLLDQNEGGSKRRRAGKEPESTSAPKEKTSKSSDKSKEGFKYHHTSTGKSAQVEEPIHADEDLEELAHQEFDIEFTEEQPVDETTQHHDWFQKPTKPPTPDRGYNKTLPAKHGPVQPWISTLARNKDPRESFNELMDTPLDFSAFVMNQLKVDTLAPELLAGPTYDLMKGSCKCLVELEYFLEEVCKATTNQLDWNNPEGQQYPHDLRKPLPLIPNSRDLTKTKAADYGHIKWIEDFILNPMESTRDVYSTHRILAVTKLKIIEWHNYKHLDWIIVCRNDDKMYTFKEGDYNRLRLQDIEDMLLLLVQGKLTNLNVKKRLALGVSLRMFTRSVVLKRRVEYLQLGVESYQKKLNLTRPNTYRSDLKRKTRYTTYSNSKDFIYQNKDKKNRLMRIDELHKFSDGTLNDVRSALDDILNRIRMEYLPQTVWRNVDRERVGAMIQAIDR